MHVGVCACACMHACVCTKMIEWEVLCEQKKLETGSKQILIEQSLFVTCIFASCRAKEAQMDRTDLDYSSWSQGRYTRIKKSAGLRVEEARNRSNGSQANLMTDCEKNPRAELSWAESRAAITGLLMMSNTREKIRENRMGLRVIKHTTVGLDLGSWRVRI